MTQDARSAIRWRHLAAMVAIAAGGCATLGSDPGQPLVPTRYETRTGPFIVYTSMAIPADATPVRCLRTLERDLAANLGLRVPADGPKVEVYILRDREAFTHFLTFYYPELPPRRAFFLAQGPRRVIYAFHNDRLEEDLRHEATHALLNVALGDLPLWLDEGLAEYFEGTDWRRGLNREHLTRLPDDFRTGWRPDLGRLATLKSVRDMSPRDYRESWAWVHYLLNGEAPGRAALLAQLGDAPARPRDTELLSYRLSRLNPTPPTPAGLSAHLDRVRTTPTPPPIATAPGQIDPTVLLQNSLIPPPRRSVFGRILAFLGFAGR